MKIQESGENYLETILILKKKNNFVRAIDLASELGYSKPSISRAIGILKEAGYLIIESSGNIVLTDSGLKHANEIYEKHVLITDFLVKSLGISEEIADKDACKIEHVISDEIFEKIKEYISKNKKHP